MQSIDDHQSPIEHSSYSLSNMNMSNVNLNSKSTSSINSNSISSGSTSPNNDDVKRLFMSYDKDNLGYISCDQFIHICKDNQMDMDEDSLNNLLNLLDPYKTGYIDYTQFINGFINNNNNSTNNRNKSGNNNSDYDADRNSNGVCRCFRNCIRALPFSLVHHD